VLARQGVLLSGSSRRVSLRRPIDLTVRVMTNGCYFSRAWPAFVLTAKMSAIFILATMWRSRRTARIG
jgi:hypothetical protein